MYMNNTSGVIIGNFHNELAVTTSRNRQNLLWPNSCLLLTSWVLAIRIAPVTWWSSVLCVLITLIVKWGVLVSSLCSSNMCLCSSELLLVSPLPSPPLHMIHPSLSAILAPETDQTVLPDFSTILTPTPLSLMHFSCCFFSSDPGVAGTNTTLRLPLLLNQLIFFPLLSSCLSICSQVFGLYRGWVPWRSMSHSFRALKAERITSPLELGVYPANCILIMYVSTCPFTVGHVRLGEHLGRTLSTSFVGTVRFVRQESDHRVSGLPLLHFQYRW